MDDFFRQIGGFRAPSTWRIQGETRAILDIVLSKCRVSFCDPSGTRHEVEVTAESLFEAAVCGAKLISDSWTEPPALMTRIEVQVIPPAIKHVVTLKQVSDWLKRGSLSPKEVAMKEKLKGLLPNPIPRNPVR